MILMHTDRYSRMVAWLKVTLPLVALGMLSTLFLISRAVDPPSTIPFADSEVQERLTNQQVTGPYYTSMSANGDQIAVIAETMTGPTGVGGTNKGKNVDIEMKMASGSNITAYGNDALIDIANDRSTLNGDVKITTSTGYVLYSDELLLRMSVTDVTSPRAVRATTPLGDLEAGAMRFFVPEGQEDGQWVFTKGVKLLHNPDNVKE